MTRTLEALLVALSVGVVLGVALAASIVGAALTFVIGRWCARLLGWY
jgi:membrane protein DedA with SNARE-associated domain